MKRHEGLRPLSRDHHPALVKAKQMGRVPVDAPESERRRAADEALSFWEADLVPHFRKEEDSLLPALARYTRPDLPEVVETLVQHVAIRGLVGRIRSAREAGDVEVEDLHRLGELLSAHVRYEEKTLFPLTEQVLPPDELMRVHRDSGG